MTQKAKPPLQRRVVVDGQECWIDPDEPSGHAADADKAEPITADALPIDAGISRAVSVLRASGVETFESCEGGDGHAYPEPTVRFHGGSGAGWTALGVLLDHDLPVCELRRTWPYTYGAPTGPYWEVTFRRD